VTGLVDNLMVDSPVLVSCVCTMIQRKLFHSEL